MNRLTKLGHSRSKKANKENPASYRKGTTELRLPLNNRLLILKPVSGSKRHIQPANQPPHLKPWRPSIGTEWNQPEAEAEAQPAKEHDQSSFEKHRLRLRELFDRIEGEYRLRKGAKTDVVIDAAVEDDGGARLGEYGAGVGGGVVEVAWIAGT